MRKHHKRHISIFSNSEKRLLLLHAQVNGKFPNSSRSCLKHHCSTKWIENYDAVFIFKEFYSAVAGSLDQLSGSGYALFESNNNSWVRLEVINAAETYQNSCKEATGYQEIILTALDATNITSCKDVTQAFRENEEVFVGLFRHADGVYGESIPIPRIVNWQANRANLLAVSPLQFFRRSVSLPFVDTALE